MPLTQSLPRGQQLLLQRLMAAHVLSDDDAQAIFAELSQYDNTDTQKDDEEEAGEEDDNDGRASQQQPIMGEGIETLEDAFVSINQQLKPGFGLEIVTMVDQQPDGSPAERYHAVVDLLVDDVAKKHSFEKSYSPHERAFIRLLMQKLVEDDNLALRKMDCINLRTDLKGNFKLSLQQAERLVQVLLDEHWLRVSTRVDDDDDDEEEEDNDHDGEDVSQPRGRQKTSKNKRRRRDSVRNKLELAPRSYMELSHYLSGLGLDDDDLPQFLFHRGNADDY
jgi:hypothetical protein